MTGRIELVHNFTGEPAYVIIQWYETTSPLTPASGLVNGSTVTQVVYPAPHGQETLLIEQIDPVMFLVKAFRSADGVALDEEINVLAVDAAIAARYGMNMITYIVGRGDEGDPEDGDTELRDPRLLDKLYYVNERGTGPMIPPIDGNGDPDPLAEYTDRSDDGGGFDWTDPAKTFNEGAVYTVKVIERMDVDPGGGGGGSSDLNDVVIMNADDDYDIATHAGKWLIASGSGTVRTLNMIALNATGDSKFLMINEGSQNYFVLQLQPGDSTMFLGNPVNRVCLEKGANAWVIIKNNTLYVKYSGQARQRGRWVMDFDIRSSGPFLVATGFFGLLEESDYPGLYDAINAMPSSVKTTTSGAWTAAQHKYFIDTVNGQFRLPILTNFHQRAFGSDTPGTYEADGVGNFTANMAIRKEDTATTDSGTGRIASGGGAAPIEPSGINLTGVLVNTGNTETKVKSVKQYPLICL